MIEFTKEEIRLCKQVAEKHKLPFNYGGWSYIKNAVWNNADKCFPIEFGDIGFPLWTISDCLKFLREKGCKNYLHLLHHETPLIASLKAVLAVVGEKS